MYGTPIFFYIIITWYLLPTYLHRILMRSMHTDSDFFFVIIMSYVIQTNMLCNGNITRKLFIIVIPRPLLSNKTDVRWTSEYRWQWTILPSKIRIPVFIKNHSSGCIIILDKSNHLILKYIDSNSNFFFLLMFIGSGGLVNVIYPEWKWLLFLKLRNFEQHRTMNHDNQYSLNFM